jgi:PHD/YefM family antitoxin component YafN of YafNO toxin-antitoxin module
METTKVGIREFRSDLAEYIASNTPVAVTRHGQTVGYFIPTRGQAEADTAALKNASKTLDKLLAAQGVDVDSVVADFKAARTKASTSSKKFNQAGKRLAAQGGRAPKMPDVSRRNRVAAVK